ncbi:MAG: DUF86 domain-containing protein [Candidatus Paceibacterota bacterium]
MKEDNVYLNHILEAIESIEEYLEGFNYELFSKDKKTIDAVVRELEIIGEASNNLSEKLKNDYSHIPFRDIIDMRNVLTHEYFGVNTKIVWDTCQVDLPGLKEVIKNVLDLR